MSATFWTKSYEGRRSFIGGSDARTIMGTTRPPYGASGGRSEATWSRKTCRAISSSSSGSRLRHLNRQWYERDRASGQRCPKLGAPPVLRWMAATLDGMVERTGAVFEAKFITPPRPSGRSSPGAGVNRHRSSPASSANDSPWLQVSRRATNSGLSHRFRFFFAIRRPKPPVSSSSMNWIPACSNAA